MGRRKLTREELVEVAGGGGGSGAGLAVATRAVDPHALHDTSDVTSLQQTAGNRAATTAVQTLAVQRRGGGAASTDAPGVKKKKPEPEQEDYAPTGHDPDLTNDDEKALLERANQDAESTAPNDWSWALRRYKELWYRTKTQGYGIPIAKMCRKLKDEKQAAYWQAVAFGKIKPGEKHVSDGSDQHA